MITIVDEAKPKFGKTRKFAKKFAGIYIIECKPLRKTYVGASLIDCEGKLREHITALISGVHRSPILQADFNRFPISKFRMKVVTKFTGRDFKALPMTTKFVMINEELTRVILNYKSNDPMYGYNARKYLPTKKLPRPH